MTTQGTPRDRPETQAGARPKEDARGRRFVAAIECILNQNARVPNAASFPAMNWTVLQLCMRHSVGVLQIPCPEMTCLGLRRERPPGASIWDVLDTEQGRRCCRALSGDLADRIQQYVQNEYRILAVLGGNPRSPGCAVHNGPDGLVVGSGVFMREFQTELRRRGIEVPFRGIRDNDAAMMQEDVSWLEGVLSRSEE